jgi:diguanylate cyclase (GGDEF)-like protein
VTNFSNNKEKTVLIVDDQVSNLKMLLTFLQDHGYTVRIAESAKRALQVLEGYTPDCILLDVMMPEISGFELCQTLQLDQKTAGIPILFMSALDAIEDKIRGFAVGGVDYITKPFQDVEVLARVNTHITLRRQKLELERVQTALLLQTERLEQLSITDDLTGLHNRRCLKLVLDREFQRGIRHNSNLSCLALDLDHFKRVNDTYGHEVGDSVLQKFSYILLDAIRNTDYCFRIGGEEFIILLPETDATGSVRTADKIRLLVSGEQFSEVEHPVTVSIGISTIERRQLDKSNDLLNNADKALYTAKRNGRNRTEVYSSS